MLDHLLKEYIDDYSWEGKEKTLSRIREAIEWCKSNPKFDLPLFFPWSINYETAIYRDGEEVKIYTCNNNRFWEILDDYWATEELQRNTEESDTYPSDNFLFLSLANQKVGTYREHLGVIYEN